MDNQPSRSVERGAGSFLLPGVVYVVLALLAQAAIGGALVQSGLLPAWIGWAAIGWNVLWLVVLPLTSAGDMYYPILHHVAPLVIGVALLRK